MTIHSSIRARCGKWIWILPVLLCMTAAWHLFPAQEWMNSFNKWIEQQGPAGLILFVAAYALATILFFPVSILTIGAGLAFGLWKGMLVVSAGSTLGAGLAFLLGRHLARARVTEATQRYPKFAAIDEAIGREGWKMVALLRLSPLLPFNVSNYLYGVTRIRFWPYLGASWLGMIPGTLLYVYLGAAGKQAASGTDAGPWKWVLFGAGLVATVVVTIWISRLARRAIPQQPAAETE